MTRPGIRTAAMHKARHQGRPRYRPDHPVGATGTDSSGAGRKATFMDTWDREHAGLKRLTPGLFAERRKAYEESIGGGR